MTETTNNHDRRVTDRQIEEIVEIIKGNPDKEYKGLLKRMAEVEKVIAEIQQLKFTLRGALIMMGVLTVTNVGALFAMLKALGVVP